MFLSLGYKVEKIKNIGQANVYQVYVYEKIGIKRPNKADKENVASKERRYLSRLLELADQPPEVSGDARYPVAEEINGVLNLATKKALQAWADEALPVLMRHLTQCKQERK